MIQCAFHYASPTSMRSARQTKEKWEDIYRSSRANRDKWLLQFIVFSPIPHLGEKVSEIYLGEIS